MESRDRFSSFLTQPNIYFFGPRIDMFHQIDLHATFFEVPLANAKSVDPQKLSVPEISWTNEFSMLVPNIMEDVSFFFWSNSVISVSQKSRFYVF